MTKHLDDSEKQALDRLRKLQNRWPSFRWALLFLGLFNILSGLSSYFRHADHAFGILAMTVGFCALVLTWRDWEGNASRKLLLKLYEDS